MKKPMILTALALAVVFGAIFGWKWFVNQKMKSALARRAPFAVTVSAAPAKLQSWTRELHAVASLTAVNGVDVTSQLTGNVTGIYFHSGEPVRQGARLVQIDDSNQLAQLMSDEAKQQLARANFLRTDKLIKLRAASQAELDTARADYRSAAAAVASDRATLRKLAITAPFSGHLGIRRISLGQYVSPGTQIVTLQTWHPLYADFTLPQGVLPEIQVGQAVGLEVDAYPGQRFAGKVSAIGSQVNPATRNVDVRAALANPGDVLKPGMFGAVRLLLGTSEQVVTVPSTAIAYNTFGDYVYIVRREQREGRELQIAVETPVKVGAQREREVAIEAGVKPGDLVVTAGQVKLRNGMPVVTEGAAKEEDGARPAAGGAP